VECKAGMTWRTCFCIFCCLTSWLEGSLTDEDFPKDEIQFRMNKLWEWFQFSQVGKCDCATLASRLRNNELDIAKLRDKISQMELGMEALTRKQIGEFNQQIPKTTRKPTTMRTTASTTTRTTTTTTERTTTTKKYPRVQCGGKGFYQVGSSCYSFTFYRSVTYEKAAAFCKVSGGYLAILNTTEELLYIRHHLMDHIVSNIYPYEHVSFFVGGIVDKDIWKWTGGEEVDSLAERCADWMTGNCLAIVWDPDLECRFSLTDIECSMKDRFVCERNPE